MTSLKKVAKEAGVSTATVSHVLSDKPHVRPELRQRVLAAMRDLDYRPNLEARSLGVQKSSIIDLIVSDIRTRSLPTSAGPWKMWLTPRE